jgi:hypothetical protein
LARSQRSYKTFAADHAMPWCWACGRGPRDKPQNWYAPWIIERAHIVNKPRAADLRAVVLLGSGCHKASHGERIVGWMLPRLTTANLLWLKLQFDAANYDLAFLATKSVGRIPQPEPVGAAFQAEYAARRRGNRLPHNGKV